MSCKLQIDTTDPRYILMQNLFGSSLALSMIKANNNQLLTEDEIDVAYREFNAREEAKEVAADISSKLTPDEQNTIEQVLLVFEKALKEKGELGGLISALVDMKNPEFRKRQVAKILAQYKISRLAYDKILDDVSGGKVAISDALSALDKMSKDVENMSKLYGEVAKVAQEKSLKALFNEQFREYNEFDNEIEKQKVGLALKQIVNSNANVNQKVLKEYLEEKSRLEKLLSTATGIAIENYTKSLKKLDRDFKENYKDEKRILEEIAGVHGDISWWSNFIAPSSDTDASIVSLGKQIRTAKRDAFQWGLAFENMLKARLDKSMSLLSKKMSVLDVYKKIIQVKDGVYHILTPYKLEYKEELSALRETVTKAKEIGDDDAIRGALEELEEFQQKYMHRPYKPAYYERFKILKSLKLNARRLELFDALEEFVEMDMNGIQLNESEQDIRDSYEQELRFMSSRFNKDGKLKTDIDELDEVSKLREYQKLTSKLYDYSTDLELFNKAFANFCINLDTQNITDEQRKDEVNLWLHRNTKPIPRESWRNKVRDLKTRIATLVSLSGEYSSEIKDEIAEARDFANWLNESGELTPQNLERQKAYDIIASKAKSMPKGFTKDEYNDFEQLKEKRDFEYLEPEEEERLSAYYSRVKNSRLSQSIVDEIGQLKEQLNEIEKATPNQSFIDIANEVTNNKYNFDLLSMRQITKLLDEAEVGTPLFELAKKVTYKTAGGYTSLLSNFSEFVPVEDSEYEVTELFDGTEHPGVPNNKWVKRTVKDEYRTQKIIGETVDAKGGWLPLPIEQAADSKFSNPEYANLKADTTPEGKAIIDVLKIYTEALYAAQANSDYNDKLDTEIPRFSKTPFEILKQGDIKGLWEYAKDILWNMYSQRDIDEEKVSEQGVSSEYSKNNIPVRGKAIIDLKDVSINLGHSIVQYGTSNESKKNIAKVLPFGNALIKMLSTLNLNPDENELAELSEYFKKLLQKRSDIGAENMSVEEINRLKNIFSGKNSRASGRRLEIVQGLSDIHFRGQFTGGEKANEAFFRIINLMKFRIFYKSMGLEFGAAMKNDIAGQLNLMTNAIGSQYYGFKSFAKAEARYFSILPQFMKSSLDTKGVIGKDVQLVNLFLKENQTELGNSIGKSAIEEWAAAMKDGMFNPSHLSDTHVDIVNTLAVLIATPVKQGSKVISLADAYHLVNGKLELLPDVEFDDYDLEVVRDKITQSKIDFQGNYNTFDKAMLERTPIGSLFFFFRRYLVSSFMTNFGGQRWTSTGVKKGIQLSMFDYIWNAGKAAIQRDVSAVKGINHNVVGKGAIAASAAWGISLGLSALIEELQECGHVCPECGEEKEDDSCLDIIMNYQRSQNVSGSLLWTLLVLEKAKQETDLYTGIGAIRTYLKEFGTLTYVFSNMDGKSSPSAYYALKSLSSDEAVSNYAKSKLHYTKAEDLMMARDLYDTDNKAWTNLWKKIGLKNVHPTSLIPFTEEWSKAKRAEARNYYKFQNGNVDNIMKKLEEAADKED